MSVLLSPLSMSNELKLFNDKRLSVNEPEHLVYIKQRLAEMKADCKTEGQKEWYKTYSDFYGVDVDVKIVKEPKAEEKIAETPITETVVTEVPKKKGRPSKNS